MSGMLRFRFFQLLFFDVRLMAILFDTVAKRIQEFHDRQFRSFCPVYALGLAYQVNHYEA